MTVEDARPELPGAFAGLIPLSIGGTRPGPRSGFVFDPHRLALPAWALLLAPAQRPALLVTLDRHLDLVPPRECPPPGLDALALDEWARRRLDPRNFDHVLAAMAAGLVGDAVVIARTRLPGVVTAPEWVDPSGVRHRLAIVPTVAALSDDFGTPRESPQARDVARWLAEAPATLLDVDLDCFTSPNDAEPTEALRWPPEAIAEHLLPHGSGPFWDAVLGRCAGLTVAREPGHCGGLVSAGRLFEDVARALFVDLLGGGLP